MDYNKLTVERQLEEVKQNGYAIQHIPDPCLEVQIEAVKQNYKVYKLIKNPHEEVDALYVLEKLCS